MNPEPNDGWLLVSRDTLLAQNTWSAMPVGCSSRVGKGAQGAGCWVWEVCREEVLHTPGPDPVHVELHSSAESE